MKKNQPQNIRFSALTRALTNALNRLFFIDNNREFERLKNFIAS